MPCQVILIAGRRGVVEPTLRRVVSDSLGWKLRCVDWSALTDEPWREFRDELLIADTVHPHRRSIEFLRQLETEPLSRSLIAIVSRDADSSLLHLASDTTDDFLLWPAPDGEVRERIVRLREESAISAACSCLIPEMDNLRLVGSHPDFLKILDLLPRAARADVPVLISGETGCGKELVARAIHYLSARRDGPFVPVDCGAVPESLFENELFGHSRGAYTDAHRDQRGLVEIAAGGILFLDEVDSLPASAQSKLLRFLQERTYRRLGQSVERSVDVNVVAATSINLRQKVDRGRFRADLYFRLNVLSIELPPLRRRVSDIPLLVRHRLERPESATVKRWRISRRALLKLSRHHWPGNVRELFNVVQRASVLCDGPLIGPEHILFDLGPADEPLVASACESFNEARARVLATFERDYVADMLRKNGGNVTRAARQAGKERRTFGRLVKKYGIDRNRLKL